MPKPGVLGLAAARATRGQAGAVGGGGLSPDVWVVPDQHPHLHLDAGRVFQLQDFGQMGHHGVQPRGLGLLQGKAPDSHSGPRSPFT